MYIFFYLQKNTIMYIKSILKYLSLCFNIECFNMNWCNTFDQFIICINVIYIG